MDEAQCRGGLARPQNVCEGVYSNDNYIFHLNAVRCREGGFFCSKSRMEWDWSDMVFVLYETDSKNIFEEKDNL